MCVCWGPIFLYFRPFLKNVHTYTIGWLNLIFGPFARCNSLWRRGNTAQRHISWCRSACSVSDKKLTQRRRGRARCHDSWPRAPVSHRGKWYRCNEVKLTARMIEYTIGLWLGGARATALCGVWQGWNGKACDARIDHPRTTSWLLFSFFVVTSGGWQR
jgi:hypothetical protein